MTVKVGIVYVEMHFCDACAPHHETSIREIPTNMIRCQRCGSSSSDINERGFGCADDYEIFASSLIPGIEKYHGAAQHVGKVPRN